MMNYLKIDKDFVDLREIIPAIDTFLVEIIEDGTVKREVGLDRRNVAIHKYPSKDFRYGRFGLFDLARLYELSKTRSVIYS